MPVRGHRDRTFSKLSPGQILKQQSLQHTGTSRIEQTSAAADLNLPKDPFRSDIHTAALMQRGVLLAPLLVQWHYKVPASKPFAKWLKTKDIILSPARLSINEDTAGVHYFGTYMEPVDAENSDTSGAPQPVDCHTLWGFSSDAAMNHMFELCRGNIARLSIVENDLREFVIGLKSHISQVGSKHFSQKALVAPAAL